MSITAHDENSLCILFLCEAYRLGRLPDLLHAVQWRQRTDPPFAIDRVEMHLQLHLSQFGKPDVVFLVTDTAGLLHVVILEAKLGPYRETCGEVLPGRRFDNDYNSALNNQLALRYRAMKAFENLSPAGGYLRERTHAPNSPYAADGVRECQKPSTLALLRRVQPRYGGFALIALTLVAPSPLLAMRDDDPLFPIFHDPHRGTAARPLLGTLSWADGLAALAGTANLFAASYAALLRQGGGDDEVGEDDDRFLVGRHIVRYRGTVCLFNCRKYSFGIHQWQGDRFETILRGKNDKTAYDALRPEVEALCEAPAENMNNATFWAGYFAALALPLADGARGEPGAAP